MTWEGFRTRTEALLWSTCSKLLRRSQQLNLLTLEKDTASSLGLNLEGFNQRIKIHEHLANNILEHLAQQHQAISPRPPNADAVANCHRQNELLKAELATTRKAHDASATTTPPTMPAVNTPSSSRPSESVTSSAILPMASAAAVDGKSFDKNFAKSPVLNSLHGRSPRPPHDKKQDDPMLAATDSAHHALPSPSDQSSPQETLEHYTWKSPTPRLFVKHAPTTSTPTSLLKWANHPTRLNASRDLEPRAVLLQQAPQRVANGDAASFPSMAAMWGLEPGCITKLADKALCILIVTARTLA